MDKKVKKYLSNTQWDVSSYWRTVVLKPGPYDTSKQEVRNAAHNLEGKKRRRVSGHSSGSRSQNDREQSSSRAPSSSYDASQGATNDSTSSQVVLDNYLECRTCEEVYEDKCPEHTPDLVLNYPVIRNGSRPNRDRETAPWPLYVKYDGEEGDRVFTRASLIDGLYFGPYEGEVVDYPPDHNVKTNEFTRFVRSHPGVQRVVDGTRSIYSNWMKLVATSDDLCRVNMRSLQYKGDIYFETIRNIQKDEQLVVKEVAKFCDLPEIPEDYENAANNENGNGENGHSTKRTAALGHRANGARNGGKKSSRIYAFSAPQSYMTKYFNPVKLKPGIGDDVVIEKVKVQIPNNQEDFYIHKSNFHGYSYCIQCGANFSISCRTHRETLDLVLNNDVPRDGSVPDRAKRTLPWPLVLKQSDAGEGVFTDANLPEGLVFGPCEGRVQSKGETTSGYAWEIKGRKDIEIDAVDTSISNFIRYLLLAKNIKENNLSGMQVYGEIFYVTRRDIKKGEELKIWFGEEYAVLVGIRMEDYMNIGTKDNPEWKCEHCPNIYHNWDECTRHQKKCRRIKGLLQ